MLLLLRSSLKVLGLSFKDNNIRKQYFVLIAVKLKTKLLPTARKLLLYTVIILIIVMVVEVRENVIIWLTVISSCICVRYR